MFTEILDIVLKPEFLTAVGPFGVFLLVALYALYAMFKKYDAVQEKRITDAQSMSKEYYELSAEINKTLDTLLTVLGNKQNGSK